MTAPVRFRLADIKRATVGVQRAGLHAQKVEIDPVGKITIFTGQPKRDQGFNEWADLE